MHSNQAVGRAVGVLADDRNKRIVVRARISKGAESTWQKILDQTLRYFSVGGTRLRSTMLPNGVRRTDEYRLNEVSLVDVGANPSAQFKIVKSLDGRPTVTDIVASDSEADYYACAEAIEKVAVQLAAACRPLPEEVSRALFLCGSPVVCNALDPFDPGMKGPGIAVDLRACAKAMRMGDDAQAEKGRTAAAGVLLKLPCRRDLAKYRGRTGTGQWGPESRGVTLEGLQAELAKCLDSLRGMRGPLAEEAIAKMETSVMAVHTVRKAAGVASTGLGFTRSELEAMREDIDARLKEWQASGRPRTPEYHTLEGQAFQVRQYLKTGRW